MKMKYLIWNSGFHALSKTTGFPYEKNYLFFAKMSNLYQ